MAIREYFQSCVREAAALLRHVDREPADRIDGRDRVGARVGHDQHRAVVLGGLGHRHRDAGVHGADDDVDVVALDELVGVLGRLGRIGFVVDGEELEFPAAQLAAAVLDRQVEEERFARLPLCELVADRERLLRKVAAKRVLAGGAVRHRVRMPAIGIRPVRTKRRDR